MRIYVYSGPRPPYFPLHRFWSYRLEEDRRDERRRLTMDFCDVCSNTVPPWVNGWSGRHIDRRQVLLPQIQRHKL